MPISLTIEANDLAELQALSKKFLAELTAANTNEPVVGEVLAPEPAPPPARRGRKPAAETPKAPDGPKQIDIEEVTAKPVEVTKDDVISELQLVNTKFGMAEVRELLNPFGCNAIKELKPEQYAGVVAAAKAKLAA